VAAIEVAADAAWASSGLVAPITIAPDFTKQTCHSGALTGDPTLGEFDASSVLNITSIMGENRQDQRMCSRRLAVK
jgi:hypothetical protein